MSSSFDSCWTFFPSKPTNNAFQSIFTFMRKKILFAAGALILSLTSFLFVPVRTHRSSGYCSAYFRTSTGMWATLFSAGMAPWITTTPATWRVVKISTGIYIHTLYATPSTLHPYYFDY
jgi:hypothetical protein